VKGSLKSVRSKQVAFSEKLLQHVKVSLGLVTLLLKIRNLSDGDFVKKVHSRCS